ncbi:MAG: hexokinase [Kiritimatiellae bacterium]|jgi:hexokinase|nr:hexokinase [Kiritimatiellia bacterium]
MNLKSIAEKFLTDNNFSTNMDTDAILDSFFEEMNSGLTGAESSLQMIPSYLDIEKKVPVDKPVIVLDAGGTNFRVCLVSFNADGVPTISKFKKRQMPGIDKEITKDEFFKTVAEVLLPYLPQADNIGFCFSYATEITPNGDGKLLNWSKEVKIPELVGEYVGSGIIKALGKVGENHNIVLLNDTIATLLSGKTIGFSSHYSSYIGFILGTGTNTAYVEANANIKKISGLTDGTQAVNVESGCFSKAPKSNFDDALAAKTESPEAYKFEKMISGAYMGSIGLEILQQAAKEGLMSEEAAKEILNWKFLSTKDLDDFVGNPSEDGIFNKPIFSEDDKQLIYHWGAAITKRSAILTAINISAAAIKCGAGTNPLTPLCINIDGSTFYKTNHLASIAEEYLRRILDFRGVYYRITKIDDSPIIGAAIAGLTHF